MNARTDFNILGDNAIALLADERKAARQARDAAMAAWAKAVCSGNVSQSDRDTMAQAMRDFDAVCKPVSERPNPDVESGLIDFDAGYINGRMRRGW